MCMLLFNYPVRVIRLRRQVIQAPWKLLSRWKFSILMKCRNLWYSEKIAYPVCANLVNLLPGRFSMSAETLVYIGRIRHQHFPRWVKVEYLYGHDCSCTYDTDSARNRRRSASLSWVPPSSDKVAQLHAIYLRYGQENECLDEDRFVGKDDVHYSARMQVSCNGIDRTFPC